MTIPIVQGTAVDPHDKSTPVTAYAAAGYQTSDPMTTPINVNHDYGSKDGPTQQLGLHAKQPNQFRDSFWAVLFILHFIPLILYAVYSASEGEGDAGQGASLNIGPHLFWVSFVALVAFGLSSFSLGGLMKNASGVVKFSLIVSVALGGLIGIYGLMVGQVLVAILGSLQLAIGVCYACAVWSRIPYAVANLRTGLTAVKTNMGLIMVAYIFMALGFAWTILFFLGFGDAINQASYPILFCWLVSFYWIHQVLQYSVHVICAGVVATWWFNPLEASGCFSSALQDSMVRALTYSFGSICFGALLVAIVRALRVTLETARNNDDAAFLVCILECILGCIEDMLEYLNQWAYIYIGVYGFSYLDAGREVINLFQQRGWTVLITDDLVDRVILVMSLCIGLISGLFGMFMGQDAVANAGVEEASMVAFGYSFLVGFLFASVALGIVGSAVNTTIVLFCEAPAELQRNHPALSHEMRSAWAGAWPELNIN